MIKLNEKDINTLKQSEHYEKNRGYLLEDVGEHAGLWTLKIRTGKKWDYDGITTDGQKAQIKLGSGGQIASNCYKEYIQEGMSDIFIIGVKHRKDMLLYYFTKDGLLQYLEDYKEGIKKKDGKYRLNISTRKGSLQALNKNSYNTVRIQNYPHY